MDVECTLFARAQRCGLAFWLAALLACTGDLSCAARAGCYAVEDEWLALDTFFKDFLRFRGREGLAEDGVGGVGHGGCGWSCSGGTMSITSSAGLPKP